MITWRSATVVSHGRSWHGALELEVSVAPSGRVVRALAYPELVGAPAPGSRVLLNVAAQERGLGTGGYALVVAAPDDLPPDPPAGPGHLVKARYTPSQVMVLGVDEQDSPWHETLRDAGDLGGMPVVTADLHSALPAIVAGVRRAAAEAGAAEPRVVYVMTDGGALPAWFSRTVCGLREAGWIAACVTAGQAFGGDAEAVSVHSALLASRHALDADVAVVAQGPGNLGTGTRWGFSGVMAGEAVNAAAVLGGLPVASLRVSASDSRERHLGVSHHSRTAYGRVALAPADVVVPRFAEPGLGWLDALVASQVAETGAGGRHRIVTRAAGPSQLDYLGASPVPLSTMGRTLEDDPTPFLAAAVAGEHAGLLHMRAPGS